MARTRTRRPSSNGPRRWQLPTVEVGEVLAPYEDFRALANERVTVTAAERVDPRG